MQVTWKIDGVVNTTLATTPTPASPSDPQTYLFSINCSDASTLGLAEGIHKVTVDVFDNTGDPAAANDDEIVRIASHATDHHYTRTWYIIYGGTANNLMIRDFKGMWDNDTQSGSHSDGGSEPWTPPGWYFDHSSDIKVSACTTSNCSTSVPIITSSDFEILNTVEPSSTLDNDYYIYIRVKNIGCSNFTAEANTLHVYASVNGSETSWDSPATPTGGNWTINTVGNGYEITPASDAADIPDVNSGDEVVITVPWHLTTTQWNMFSPAVPCLLVRFEVTDDPIIDPATLTDPDPTPVVRNLTNWIRYNNNIAMRNLTPVEVGGHVVEEIGGKPYIGTYTFMGNTKHTADTFDLSLTWGSQAPGMPVLTEEAEVIVYFKENGWDVSTALTGTLSKGLTRLDSTLFLASEKNVKFDQIIIPADTVIPVFIGVAFLTQKLKDSTEYVLHLDERRSSAKDNIFWAHHYQFNRNPSRTLFTADAGTNQDVIFGDSITLTAAGIGEDALYIWHDKSGAVVGTGQSICIVPDTTMDYKLEVIAEADGYKDYDQVNVNVSKGQITSVLPNPATTTTLVYYSTSSVTTAKIKVVAVSTFTEVDNFTVTAGTGTKSIDISGYTTGAYIITLEGDSHNLDSETLIVE